MTQRPIDNSARVALLRVIHAAVAKGAALLDAQPAYLGWRKNIDLETFNIASECRCVGGQLEGGYEMFVSCFVPSDVDRYYWAVEHGFLWPTTAAYDDKEEYIARLQAAWELEILRDPPLPPQP